MKKHAAIIVGASLASTLWVSAAAAQHTYVTTRAHETVVSSGPNSGLLGSGLFAFGAPYVASVIVASTSSNSADHNLYIPVAGPWMDFANRGPCGGLFQPSCDTETANKVLLAADGVFQGIGALEIVGAFLTPETRTVTVASEPHVIVGPSSIGRTGYGLAAIGRF
jgi:hypothetical protein